MYNWIITLVNTLTPFDRKQVLVRADSIIEAFDPKKHNNKGYYAVSARACPDSDVPVFMSKLVGISNDLRDCQ